MLLSAALAALSLLVSHASAGGLNVPLPENNLFDYVIVGGGPAGLTVAQRLTEDPSVTVLVLEAGNPDHYEDYIMIPYLQGVGGRLGPGGSCGGYNWCDTSAPQTYLDGRTRVIPQGRGLGGGTLINAFLVNRGDPADYDTWAALGNEGWDYASLLPFFKRSETFTPESQQDQISGYAVGYDASQHGTDGPQNNGFPNFYYQAGLYFKAAMQAMNIGGPVDATAPTQKGYMFLPEGILTSNQSRNDARRARYDTVASRANLYVSTGQTVQRVLFEGGCSAPGGNGARAVGVLSSAGAGQRTWTAIARREVILAAGAVRTPQVLQLSGIGPRDVLTRAGVQTRIALPGVGNNLQDHALLHFSQAFNNQSLIYPNILNNQTIMDLARQQYYNNRSGPWTFGPPNPNGFLSTPQYSSRADQYRSTAEGQSSGQYLADGLDATVISGYNRQKALLIPALNDNSRGAIEFLQDNAGNTQISNQRPLSRGSSHISNNDPFTYPIIDFRYASNPVDFDLLFDAVHFNNRLFQSPELQTLQPTQSDPPANPSDDQIRSFINRALGTEYHPSGTAAMMPREDGGVVDPNLLVYGTQNLRVVDCSIHPIIPAAHLQTVAYGVAEKASDIIKAANSPSVDPQLPLDQTQCTTAAASRMKRHVSVEARLAAERRAAHDYPPNNVHSPRRRVEDYTPSFPGVNGLADGEEVSCSGYFSVGYPNYNPTNPANYSQTPGQRPASVGQPVGKALEWAERLLSGHGRGQSDLLGQIVQPLEQFPPSLGKLVMHGLDPEGGY